MKLWEKGYQLDNLVEQYTVGDDWQLDRNLIAYDCRASIAHAGVLRKAGILRESERRKLVRELRRIEELDRAGKFRIAPSDEDVHTAIEAFLVEALGDLGKKIHTARSRNDQVATALRLYCRDKLAALRLLIRSMTRTLRRRARQLRGAKMPGYTHARRAMPSSFAIWLEAAAESMQDNDILLRAVLSLLDQSPLGTGAGYGIPVFRIDRGQSAHEMGFRRVQKNPLYVQNSRGKFEAIVVSAATNIMFDLNKTATDLILFSMEEFGFVKLPRELCTGSSIMPQKKNPDVLEIVRARYHVVVSNEFRIKSIIGNLMSGYNRDLQLTKKPLMESLDVVELSLQVMMRVIESLEVDTARCLEACTPEIHATEEAYRLAASGMPFRDAYRKVAERYGK